MLLEKLFGFYHVAAEQSFTRAAEKINISQPNLSKYIAALEKHFDKKLLVKHNKQLQLTEEGQILFATAQKMLEDYNFTEKLIRHNSNSVEGQLRIGMDMGLSQTWTPQIIAEFSRAYPKMQLTLTGAEKELDIMTGDFDVIVGPRLNYNVEKFTQTHLCDITWSFYAAPSYLEAHGTPKKIEELAQHKVAAYHDADRHVYGTVATRFFEGQDDVVITPQYTTNSEIALVAYVHAGMGIALIQEDSPCLANYNLTPLPQLTRSAKNVPVTKLTITYPTYLAESGKLKAFIQHFSSAFLDLYDTTQKDALQACA